MIDATFSSSMSPEPPASSSFFLSSSSSSSSLNFHDVPSSSSSSSTPKDARSLLMLFSVALTPFPDDAKSSSRSPLSESPAPASAGPAATSVLGKSAPRTTTMSLILSRMPHLLSPPGSESESPPLPFAT